MPITPGGRNTYGGGTGTGRDDMIGGGGTSGVGRGAPAGPQYGGGMPQGSGYAPGSTMFPGSFNIADWVRSNLRRVQERMKPTAFATPEQGSDANLPGREQGYFGLSGLGLDGGMPQPGMGSQSNLMVGGLEQYRVQRMLQLLNQMGLF